MIVRHSTSTSKGTACRAPTFVFQHHVACAVVAVKVSSFRLGQNIAMMGELPCIVNLKILLCAAMIFFSDSNGLRDERLRLATGATAVGYWHRQRMDSPRSTKLVSARLASLQRSKSMLHIFVLVESAPL
jgi:hypothetical protein